MDVARGLVRSRRRSPVFTCCCTQQRVTVSTLILILAVFWQLPGTAAVCPDDMCPLLFCPEYGRAFDADGCIQCACLSPCQNVTCPAGEQCEPAMDAGCDGLRCQMYRDSCVPARAGPSTTPCPTVDCPLGSCRFGFKRNGNGCILATCECVDLCEEYDCPAGTRCELTADDCNPGENCRDGSMPHCVTVSTSTRIPTITTTTHEHTPQLTSRSTVVADIENSSTVKVSSTVAPSHQCQPDSCPGMFCLPYGRSYDADGCIECGCLLPCMGVTCANGQVCQPEPVPSCSSGGCAAFRGACVAAVSTTTQAPCPLVNCSSVTCRFGFKSDANGCMTCNCIDPCEGLHCEAGKTCRLTADDCVPTQTSNCRDGQMAYCAQDPSSSTSSTVFPTSMSHQCQPLEPHCQLNICSYGHNIDSYGCEMCNCLYPCMDVTCETGKICQVVPVEGCTNTSCLRYRGLCTAVPTASTSRPCPALRNCTITGCPLKRDHNSCEICECYDPCESYTCPAGQRCELTLEDCDGSNCRDGPMPHCVAVPVSISTSVSLSPPTHSSFGDCCLAANIGHDCLAFCTYDVMLQADDVLQLPVPSRCVGILHCATDGIDRRDCCSKMNVTSQCLAMCDSTVSGPVDGSCMADYYNMLRCRATISAAPSSTTTTTPTTTPSTTTTTTTTTEMPTSSSSTTTPTTTTTTTTTIPSTTTTMPKSSSSSTTTTPSSTTTTTTTSTTSTTTTEMPTSSSSTTTTTIPSTTTPMTRMPTSSSSSTTTTPSTTPSTTTTTTTTSTTSTTEMPTSSSSTTTTTIPSTTTPMTRMPTSSSSSTTTTPSTTTTTSTSTTTEMSKSSLSTTTTRRPTTRRPTTTTTISSQQVLASGLLKILAQFDIIINEQDFKQFIAGWLGSKLGVEQNSIAVKSLREGSILVDFNIVQSPDSETVITASELAGRLSVMYALSPEVTFNGMVYSTSLVNYTVEFITNPTTVRSTTSIPFTPPRHDDNDGDSKHYNFFLLVILVCVLVPIGLATIIFIAVVIYKRWKGEPLFGGRVHAKKNWDVVSENSSTDENFKGIEYGQPRYVTIEPSKRKSQIETNA